MQIVEPQILNAKAGEFSLWRPEDTLVSLSESDLSYANGFSSGRFSALFPQLIEHWSNFFSRFEQSLSVSKIYSGFVFPQTVEKVVSFKLKDELNIVALSERDIDVLKKFIAVPTDEIVIETLSEYILRRLVVSLAASWEGEEHISFEFVPPDEAVELEVLGVVTVEFKAGADQLRVVFGIGPELTDFINKLSKKKNKEINSLKFQSIPQKTDSVDLCLAGLSVDRSILKDIAKPGTMVLLKDLQYGKAGLRIDSNVIASGDLVLHDKSFGVRVEGHTDSFNSSDPEEDLPVITLGGSSFDRDTLMSGVHIGGFLPSSIKPASEGFLKFRGEQIARITYGFYNGEPCFKVG